MASGTWGDPNVYTKAETDAAISQSAASVVISATKGTKVNEFIANIMLCGKIVVISVYMTFNANVSRSDVLATLDLPSNFVKNWFNGDAGFNLGINSKNLLADKAFASGASAAGQIIGVIS